jgi:hypothetical protein
MNDGEVLSHEFNGPAFMAIFRDMVCTILGGIGFFHEMILKETPNTTLLAICGVLLGVPGISGSQILKRFFTEPVSPPSASDSSSSSRSLD